MPRQARVQGQGYRQGSCRTERAPSRIEFVCDLHPVLAEHTRTKVRWKIEPEISEFAHDVAEAQIDLVRFAWCVMICWRALLAMQILLRRQSSSSASTATSGERYHAASSRFAPWMPCVDRRPHNPQSKKGRQEVEKSRQGSHFQRPRRNTHCVGNSLDAPVRRAIGRRWKLCRASGSGGSQSAARRDRALAALRPAPWAVQQAPPAM